MIFISWMLEACSVAYYLVYGGGAVPHALRRICSADLEYIVSQVC